MRLTLVQQDIVWGNPEANRAHLDELLSQTAPGSTDLIVLPEMFSTGFVTTQPQLAEQTPSATLEWMRAKAARTGAAITGSLAVRDGDRCFNRLYFVKPSGETLFYDKRHLFAYGGEDRTFTAGSGRVIVEWCGLKILLAVCYDLRFPVWLRNRADYDGILLVANWPDKRRYAWDVLTRARAIENQCFLAAVNRVGTDPVCTYDGGTCFISQYGDLEALATPGEEELINIDFNPATLKEYRQKFPVLQDADNFELL